MARRALLLLTAALVVGGTLFAAPAQAAFPGANGKLAFSKSSDVYSMNPDGTALTRLTTDGLSSGPAWSPDGSKIAFTTRRDDPTCTYPCNYEIYVMNADGSNPVRLTNDPAGDYGPSWSPDGSKIAFTRVAPVGTNSQIFVMNADGSGPTNISNSSRYEDGPAWSPDGTTIAYANYNHPATVGLMNPDGSNKRLLGYYGGDPVHNFDWSPDSKYLVIEAHNDEYPDGIHIALAVDGSWRWLTFDDEEYPVWSPDGKRIAFDTCGYGACNLELINPDGSDRVTMLSAAAGADWQRLPVAAYPRPQSASPLSVSLVPLFRQCGTGATPVNGKHSPPLGTGSCNPPSPQSVVARVGPTSQGSAQLAVVAGDSDATNGDQADVAITTHLTDVLTTGGGDYNPNPSGADMTQVTRLRLTDRSNNYGGASGTTTDLDFAVPVDCTTTAGPEGATCDATTSADAVTPGAIQEQRGTVAQVFRIRVYDSGTNGVRENGAGDDRIFAHQGIYVP